MKWGSGRIDCYSVATYNLPGTTLHDPYHHDLAMASGLGASPLLRLTPLLLSELPPHPDLPLGSSAFKSGHPKKEDVSQPDLLPFIVRLLNDGLAFLSKTELETSFKKSSTKKAEGSNASVDVLVRNISRSMLERDVPWHTESSGIEVNGASSRRASKATEPDGRRPSISNNNTLDVPTSTTRARSPSNASARSTHSTSTPKIRRAKPRDLRDEHWFTRRSVHNCVSAKLEPGTASWEQFVFGLLHNHSKNEQEFTPNLYDAPKVVDWDGQVRKLDEEGSLRREGWGDVSISINEMCHALPGVLAPRCFDVLVVGGKVLPEQAAEGGGSSSVRQSNDSVKRWDKGEKQKFVVVTVPVQLGMGVKKAFYANSRNLKEGKGQQAHEVVQGLYAAVEMCTLRAKEGGGKDEEEVEWIMSTASDAEGNLPMWVQRLSIPGVLPKDVSFFMKWIKDVDEARIEDDVGNV